MGTAAKVLIVDDTALMRATLKRLLDRKDGVEVIGSVGSGALVCDKIRELKPDVVTLDVEMPGMDGFDTLERVMQQCPTPVIMFSSHTQEGASKTIAALEAGAVDCVGKPTGSTGQTLDEVINELAYKICSASKAKVQHGRGKLEAMSLESCCRPGEVVCVGISMGGPPMLTELFKKLPAGGPPILITQHMPAGFTRSFAERLDSISEIAVSEAQHGETVRPGHAYVAPGGTHMEISKAKGQYVIQLASGDPVCGHQPSVDVLFRSLARTCGDKGTAIIMTGMGRDGAEAIGEVSKVGGHAYGQDADSCVVYGMPRAAFDLGTVERQLGLQEIAHLLSGQKL